MKSMAEHQVNGNLDEIGEQARALATFVEQSARDGIAAHEVEKSVWNKIIEMGRTTFGMFFRLCGDGDEGERVVLSDGREVRRLEGLHRREYQSVFGHFDLYRAVYGTWEARKIDYVPLDAKLRLPESKFSYLLQDWDQSLVVETPYAQVDATISKILGFTQSIHSLERCNRKLATDVPTFWENLPMPPVDQEGALMVCTADGKGLPIRGAEKTSPIEETKPTKGPKPGRKKMAMVGAVYTVDRFERSPKEVLEALFRVPGETPDSSPPCRPKPLTKHIRTSLIRDAAGTSLPSFDEIFGWMEQEVRLRNADGERPIVLLMDGQEALWNAGLKHLPEKLQVTEILDLIHAASYLWKAAHVFHPQGSPAALGFVKERMKHLLDGKVTTVIRGLRWMGTHQGLTGKRAQAIETVCGYFGTNVHRMAYDDYLAAGYPVASGVIEGACRHVVKDRMERSGMRWVLHGAHSMLGLRCIYLSGLWDEFIQFHIDQERQRLYPRSAANDPDIPLPLVA